MYRVGVILLMHIVMPHSSMRFVTHKCPLTPIPYPYICLILQAVELPLMLSQTAAIMEVLHSLVGLVRSPVTVTGQQRLRFKESSFGSLGFRSKDLNCVFCVA